jgi:alanyl-tRNA synthetase
LCGGTHVAALGQIGPVRIVSEGSIGSNLRRLEATTGSVTLARLRHDERVIGQAAQLLKATPDEFLPALERRLGELRAIQDELKSVRQAALADRARSLAAAAMADGGAVVARVDGLEQRQLQELALTVRAESGVKVVVLGGSAGEGKAALVAAVAKGGDLIASDLIAGAAKVVGGGGGKNPEVAMAGGRDPSRLDEALDLVRQTLGLTV